MNTPVFDFLQKYNKHEFSRFHMPGHKGKGNMCEKFDITEIKGADSLFEADGIIMESEKNASSLFGTKCTLYSTQGSTLAIQTMLTLATSKVDNPIVIAVRNAHKAFINACVLLDIDVKWVFPEYVDGSITSGIFTPDDIENAIKTCERKPSAVYITSPDYLGRMAYLKPISEICRKYDVPLLVDNAHGAYLNFLDENIHPMNSGADMCSDSAHKTLPVLTGGGYLHISEKSDKSFSENAKSAMSVFASTSPSYLTLASLDLCNKYLDEKIKDDLKAIIPHINELKKQVEKFNFINCSDEPLKVSLYTLNTGLHGYEIADMLRESKIECEYADETHIVFMISTMNTPEEIKKLKDALISIKQPRIRLEAVRFNLTPPEKAMSIRKAGLSASEEISVDDALGRICSKVVVACPPGIPVVVSGEVINSDVIKILKRYSILTINVVKLEH